MTEEEKNAQQAQQQGRPTHVFFQSFGINNQGSEEIPEGLKKYLRNVLVFEIANNWPFVRCLMDKYRNGILKEVDPLERDWFNFIISNHVDVEKYGKNSDQFVSEYIQK
jgi:hypothetical protein